MPEAIKKCIEKGRKFGLFALSMVLIYNLAVSYPEEETNTELQTVQ